MGSAKETKKGGNWERQAWRGHHITHNRCQACMQPTQLAVQLPDHSLSHAAVPCAQNCIEPLLQFCSCLALSTTHLPVIIVSMTMHLLNYCLNPEERTCKWSRYSSSGFTPSSNPPPQTSSMAHSMASTRWSRPSALSWSLWVEQMKRAGGWYIIEGYMSTLTRTCLV